jgi:hypothetical protein
MSVGAISTPIGTVSSDQVWCRAVWGSVIYICRYHLSIYVLF